MSVPGKPPPGPGEDATDITAADVMWGLIYTHDRANSNTEEIEDAQATLGALVDLLVKRGLISQEELDAARTEAGEEVRKRFVRRGMAVVRQEFEQSKYDWPPGEPIDCAARVHLCHGACCRFLVALSTEDVKEGILRWETHQPYALAKTAEGSCVHMEEGTCRCRAYDARPIPCRAYDCRNDHRIWVDFEKRIPNPLILDPGWPDNVDVVVNVPEGGG